MSRTRLSAATNTWAIFQREFMALFYSPIAYVVLFLFMISNGWIFYYYCVNYARDPQQITLVIRSLFSFAFFWVLPLSPLLAMRLFSEEKRTGTIEVLMTAPVRAAEVVCGKFLATQLFYMLIWSSLLLFVLMLEVLGKPAGPDWGPIKSMYFGLFFLGCMTNSLGLLASTFSRNQLVAAVLSLSGNLLFFSLLFLGWIYRETPELQRLFHYLSFQAHFSSEYIGGVVELRYIVFYIGFTSLFLFLSINMVNGRKWR